MRPPPDENGGRRPGDIPADRHHLQTATTAITDQRSRALGQRALRHFAGITTDPGAAVLVAAAITWAVGR